jgi:hypothetical protein
MIVPAVLPLSTEVLLCGLVARPLHPAPPPLQVDTVRVVLAGTALWAVALVVLLLLGDRVDRTWVWTCVAGIVLAGLGIALMRWQGHIGPKARSRN